MYAANIQIKVNLCEFIFYRYSINHFYNPIHSKPEHSQLSHYGFNYQKSSWWSVGYVGQLSRVWTLRGYRNENVELSWSVWTASEHAEMCRFTRRLSRMHEWLKKCKWKNPSVRQVGKQNILSSFSLPIENIFSE